jgi:class 3 adenylate cyclase/sensor domain CHASE-containing protein
MNTKMKSRNRFVLIIIAAWALFVAIILIASAYIAVSGIADLEKRLAADNTNRVFRILVSNFSYIYSLNADLAYWDDTYNFIQKPNTNYIEKNFSTDFFKDNKLNSIILLDKVGNVVWSKGFDLTKKISVEPPKEIIVFFKQNSLRMLANREDYNNSINEPYGLGGFLKIPNTNDIAYFAINYISDTDETKTKSGAMIFGKIITSDFLKRMSEEFNYNISILPINEFSQAPQNKNILAALLKTDSVHTETVDENTLRSFKVLKDLTFKPIAVVQVEFPRTLYNQTRESSSHNRLVLMGFSILVMLGISALIYSFFRKQDLMTRSFERFVPRQLIELLQKHEIMDVQLGNNLEKTISVLFMDIRNFTTISEGLSPQENFDFINTVLKEIAPVVANNNGFIDKYIGDAIMALFPKEDSSADDAVRSAMFILDEMDKINYTGKVKLPSPVKIGIGINTGKAIVGIIGAEGRLEGTVISDAINTAARIQNLTKNYEFPLLISEETYKAMKHPEYYDITHVDDVSVKGKTTKVSIYKVDKRR